MNKKILKIWLIVIAVCLLIPMIYVLCNRSTKREPTPDEIEAAEAYSIDWQTVGEGSDKEIILSLCTFLEEKNIGANLYHCYSANGLECYLYDFAEMVEIAELGQELYVQYTTPAGDMVTLGYSDEGLIEKAIYNAGSDTLYHDLQGSVEVWTKFRNGFQFGEN